MEYRANVTQHIGQMEFELRMRSSAQRLENDDRYHLLQKLCFNEPFIKHVTVTQGGRGVVSSTVVVAHSTSGL